MPACVLALELSGPVSTVALARGDAVTEREFPGERGRSLLAEVDALLHTAGAHPRDLDGIVAGTGPGSYTGLRIACTAARALSMALGIPAGGLSSFQAAALLAPPGAEVHLLLDAYRGEVYHAAYARAGAVAEALVPPRILTREAARAVVPAGALLLGDPALCANAVRSLAPRLCPRAIQLLELARTLGALESPSCLAELGAPAPLYLRSALRALAAS